LPIQIHLSIAKSLAFNRLTSSIAIEIGMNSGVRYHHLPIVINLDSSSADEAADFNAV
jgi:hypothetical protein